MRKFISIFAISIVVATLSCSQTTDPGREEKDAPKMEFSYTEFDYGSVEQGGDGQCVFEFTNSGEETLILSDARSSCGCTVPSYSKEPIKHGDKGSITVKYDTRRIGPFNKSITITSNAVNSPLTLRIKGTVVTKPVAEQAK